MRGEHVAQPSGVPVPPDGLAAQELHRKNQLSAKQHGAADRLRSLIGDPLELGVLERGQTRG